MVLELGLFLLLEWEDAITELVMIKPNEVNIPLLYVELSR